MAKVTLNDLSKALGLNEKEPKKDFHYYGTIVDSNPSDNTYQVSINRDTNISVEAARLVGAGIGDTVMVTVMSNGYATVTNRLGGDLDATNAQRAADAAADTASTAQGVANSALSNAQQANQAANAARTLAEHAEEEAGRAHTAAEQAAEDASAAATFASQAASSASSANTSAQNAAADASRAAASASSAETDAARASTAATNAESDAASAASNASRAATSASNAEADAASAAASAQNAANDASSAASSASSASTSASNAAASASTAQQEASAATTAANQAKTQAQAAETAANEAKTDANAAKRDAASANAAANGAVASLAITQGVVDALGQDMDDMQTHVAMMDAVGNIPAGLHVVPSSGGYFMVIANNGVYVYDNESVLVAKYGHDISFDSNREHKIGNNSNYIRYYDANNDGVADSIEIVANNIRLGSYSVADKIAEAKQAGTDASNALNTYKTDNDARVKAVEDGLSSTDEDLANYITSQEDVIEDLQNQIDGAIDTWYYSGDPTLSNQPAVAWTTDETKENHLRDLYFNTQNGHSFRFAKEGNTYKWIQIQDADAIKALADAAAAQGTANVKKRVFVTQPTPPYDIGDLWVQGSTGDIKRCATAKTSSQSFAAADWVLASKYTDDTKANAVESDLHTNYYVKSDFSVAPDKIASTISATETTVKTYADNKASTAESNAKTYADNNFDGKGSAASALSDAKDYADDNFDSKGSASAAQAAAISAAAADATSKANAAESNAKADTTNKLKSYYTKTQTDSAITQKADNILSTVSTTYQTKADMDDYSTTAEMNSAINQKADSITSTVSQTYATKTQAQGYANTAESNAKTAAATDATNKANAAKADAISTASTDATNKANAAKQAAIDDAASKYYGKTETYTKSEIEQKAGEISLSVAQEEVEKVISVKEASGNIVHIENASEYPALSLKVHTSPIQNLNGYSKPWAGGAGKNLINAADYEGVLNTYYAEFRTKYKLTAGQTYTFSVTVSSSKQPFYVGMGCGTETSGYTRDIINKSGNTNGRVFVTFTPTAEQLDGREYFKFRVPAYASSQSGVNYSIKDIQLELGSTATSFEPYENICPISGWSSVDVEKTGKNLLKVDRVNTVGRGITQTLNEDGTITLSGTSTSPFNGQGINGSSYIKLPVGTYRFVDVGQTSGATFYYYLRVQGNPAWIQSGQTFTVPEGSSGCWIVLYFLASTTVSGTHGLMIVSENSTYDTYEPYTGTTTTTPLGRTVYGGTLDVVSGVLTVDKVMVTVSNLTKAGSLQTGTYTCCQRYDLSPVANTVGISQKHGAISNMGVENNAYYGSPRTNESGSSDVDYAIGTSGSILAVYDTDLTLTDATFADKYGSMQIVYPLATPQTYTLTGQEVSTLLGENNIWTNTGDVYLKYATMNSDMNALMNKSNADLKITADGISSEVSKKVGNDEVISKINQSAESVKIQASKVEIDGTATFNAIKSKADAAYYKSTDITSSATDKDLNNYKTTGIYHCMCPMTNAPVTNHGTLTVDWAVGTKWQEFRPDNLTYYYKRIYNNTTGAWNGWIKIDAVGAMDTAAKAAPKIDAVKRTQRIYYRTSSSTAPTTAYLPTAWVTETGNKWAANATTVANWTTKVTPISSDKTSTSATKYLYLYTCEQREMANGTLAYTNVLLDDSTTVIDGGNIITGTVTANQLNASSINASKSLTVGALTTVDQNKILNENIEVGGRNFALNTEGINASGLGSAAGSKQEYQRVSLGRELPLNAGETITVSFDLYMVVNYANPSLIVYNTNVKGPHNPTIPMTNVLSGETHAVGDVINRRISLTGELGAGPGNNAGDWLEFYSDYGSSNWFSISNLKLEKGNKATDWTPAPEDVASDIEDASKIATDYLTFTDANGLTVGKTGKKERVNIKSSGLNVYDSSDASVAEFGSTARIGKSNSSRFVTNASSLEAYNSSNQKYFEVSANGITFGTNNTVAKTSDIPTKVSDLNNDSGFQNASQVESTVTGKGYQTASQVEATVTGKGYQTSSQVESAITSKGYQNASQVSSTATTAADAAAWSVELETTYINLLENKATIKATVYKYGVKQTDGFTRAWYKNGDVISGQSGESISNVTADALYTCVIT